MLRASAWASSGSNGCAAARHSSPWPAPLPDRDHRLPIAPNLVDRNFTVATPNQVWVGDLTAIPTDEGGLFLTSVLDPFSRQVVGWSMRADMGREPLANIPIVGNQRIPFLCR